MSTSHKPTLRAATSQQVPRSRLSRVAFPDDDDGPVPSEYQDKASRVRWQYTRGGRALLCYRRLVDEKVLPQPASWCDSYEELLSRPIRHAYHEGQAKVIALRRFVDQTNFSEYADAADEEGDLIFFPAETTDEYQFVTKRGFRIWAGMHRYLCKCGLSSGAMLALWQSAYCDRGDTQYEQCPAYMWHGVHQERECVYRASGGYEAPEWDPFPDGRGARPRVNSEKEKDDSGRPNEQRRQREACWNAKRGRIAIPLPANVSQQHAWLPACVTPTGSAVNERSLWTAEQESTWQEMVDREQERREARKAVLRADFMKLKGIERLDVGKGSCSTHAALPAIGTEASSVAHQVDVEDSSTLRTTYQAEMNIRDWCVKPDRAREPLSIIDPANRTEVSVGIDPRFKAGQESGPAARMRPL